MTFFQNLLLLLKKKWVKTPIFSFYFLIISHAKMRMSGLI